MPSCATMRVRTEQNSPFWKMGMLNDYLKKILAARVYDVAIESPLHTANFLSERLGNQIWVKREDEQPVYSFKIRGAYNKVVQLTEEEKA